MKVLDARGRSSALGIAHPLRMMTCQESRSHETNVVRDALSRVDSVVGYHNSWGGAPRQVVGSHDIPLFLIHEKGFKLVISQPTFWRGFAAQVFMCFGVAPTLIIR